MPLRLNSGPIGLLKSYDVKICRLKDASSDRRYLQNSPTSPNDANLHTSSMKSPESCEKATQLNSTEFKIVSHLLDSN